MTSNSSKTRKSDKKRSRKPRIILLIIGFLFGAGVVMGLYQTSVYFSTNDSCAMCYEHPHATETWEEMTASSLDPS